MSIEKGESLLADMQQSRAIHAERARSHGNPARRAFVLVSLGGERRVSFFCEHLRRFEGGERHV